MASTLKIALANVMERGSAAAAALADVIPLDAKGTRRRGVIIPAGGSERTVVNVEPGRYLISTVLPSGEVVDRDVSVAPDDSVEVLLEGDVTPHEWLGWHRFSPAREMLWNPLRAPRSVVHVSLVESSQWLTTPPEGGQRLPADKSDPLTSGFEIAERPWGTRTLAIVRRDRRVDAIVVPAPWGRHDTRTVQIAVPHDADLPISIAIQDPRIGPLLGYLAAGAAPSAQRLLGRNKDEVRDLIDLLANKFENPFAAAVASFVLLTASREPGHQHWHDWVGNLAHHFEWIPDGAILHGWRALRERSRDEAQRWFAEGARRGIPVLTGTLRLLYDGLLAIGDHESLSTVQQALARADMAQPFVTLRFDE